MVPDLGPRCRLNWNGALPTAIVNPESTGIPTHSREGAWLSSTIYLPPPRRQTARTASRGGTQSPPCGVCAGTVRWRMPTNSCECRAQRRASPDRQRSVVSILEALVLRHEYEKLFSPQRVPSRLVALAACRLSASERGVGRRCTSTRERLNTASPTRPAQGRGVVDDLVHPAT
jgi:hypothetical protein